MLLMRRRRRRRRSSRDVDAVWPAGWLSDGAGDGGWIGIRLSRPPMSLPSSPGMFCSWGEWKQKQVLILGRLGGASIV